MVRCPRCTWELEDGTCGSCGWGSASDTDDSLSMDDDESAPHGWLDHEGNTSEGGIIDLDDPDDYPEALDHFQGAHGFPEPIPNYDSFLEDEDEDETDDDSVGSLDQFIVNDEDRDRFAIRGNVPPFSDSEDDISDTVRTMGSDEDHRSREETESAFSGPRVSRNISRTQNEDIDSEPVQLTGRRRTWEGINAVNSNQINRRPRSPSSDNSLPCLPIHRHRRNPRPSSSRTVQSSHPVTVSLESDTEDSAIPIQRPRRRPRVRRQISSDDDEEPRFNVNTSDEDRHGNSSGTATLGRHSALRLFPQGLASQTSSAAAPIVIDSSPTRNPLPNLEREREQSIPGAFPVSFSNTEPSQSVRPSLTSPSPSEISQFNYESPSSSTRIQGARNPQHGPHGLFSRRPSDLDATSQSHFDIISQHARSDRSRQLLPPPDSDPHRLIPFRNPSISRAPRSPRHSRVPETENSNAAASTVMREPAREAKRKRQKAERRRREQSTLNGSINNGEGTSNAAQRGHTLEL